MSSMEEVARHIQEMMNGQASMMERLTQVQRENEGLRARNDELARGTFQQMPTLISALAGIPEALKAGR